MYLPHFYINSRSPRVEKSVLMDRFTRATTDFLSLLRTRPSRAAVDEILRAATNEEEVLRRMFAQDRDNPLLRNKYLGLFDAFSVPAEVCRVRARSRDAMNITYITPQEHRELNFSTDHLFSLKPDLVKEDGEPCMVRTIKDFRSNFEIFTHGALKHIRDWDNLVVAGGAVLACLFPPSTAKGSGLPSPANINNVYQSDAYNGSDIDLFLWGLTPDEVSRIPSLYAWPV